LNGHYLINDQWSAAPSFTFFLKKDFVSWSALDLDANYKLSESKLGSLYALAGLNMTFYKITIKYDLGAYGGTTDYTSTGSDFGVNLGVGMKMPIGDKLSFVPEIRYTLGGANYLRAGVKLLYAF